MALRSLKLSLFLLMVLFFTTSEQAELNRQLRETQMTLYFQDWASGPNATIIEITGPENGLPRFKNFGAMFVTDDPITEEFDKNSAQIARGRGMYVTSALDGSHTHVLISIVFTSDEYKGSTLEIQGSSAQFEPVREVSIVGGTGVFRLARGYVTFETIHYDPTIFYAVIRCNVTVLHY